MELPIIGVFGIRGGGTSAIAGVVKLHGYQMWGEPKTLDDVELYQNIEDTLAKRPNHSWAFKHPFLLPKINFFKTAFPHFKPILVFRDPVASSQHGAGDTTELIAQDWLDQEYMLGHKDALYISYEKAIQEPELTVARIAEYIGKDVNHKAIEWLDPTLKYRNVSDYE